MGFDSGREACCLIRKPLAQCGTPTPVPALLRLCPGDGTQMTEVTSGGIIGPGEFLQAGQVRPTAGAMFCRDAVPASAREGQEDGGVQTLASRALPKG